MSGESRHQRKGFGPHTAAGRVADTSATSPWRRFWAPDRLAWWVAVIFVIGSAFFVAGAAGSLVPGAFGGEHPMSVFAETCYLTGTAVAEPPAR